MKSKAVETQTRDGPGVRSTVKVEQVVFDNSVTFLSASGLDGLQLLKLYLTFDTCKVESSNKSVKNQFMAHYFTSRPIQHSCFQLLLRRSCWSFIELDRIRMRQIIDSCLCDEVESSVIVLSES